MGTPCGPVSVSTVFSSGGGSGDLIIVNLIDHSQMVLHFYPGCVQPVNASQLGHTPIHNCDGTRTSGCTVAETKSGSFAPGFMQANDGAFMLQSDVAVGFM
ncbi:hypothetical protein B0H19DRAFT_1161457 [Mycena capillaripes]|nr:hypothetical protein B0H19DRAFT_1161457 [Mycena capillaripes]